MSETMTPKPGGTAALKQRAEAYQLTRELPRALEEAGMMSGSGMYKQAQSELQPVVEAVMRNPAAQEMLNRSNPQAWALAQRDIKEYQAAAPNQIDVVKMGQWSSTMDGVHETRTLVGKSDQGYHAAVETSRLGGDGGSPAWGRAQPTQDRADMQANRAERIWHEKYERPTNSPEAPELSQKGPQAKAKQSQTMHL